MKCPEPTSIAVQSTPQEPDDDRSFFDSLLPLVKTLPIDAKIDFRVKVMQILREMRAGSANASTSTTGHFSNNQQHIGLFPQQEMSQHTMSHFMPISVQQQHPQRFPNTQQSFNWEPQGSSNSSYTSPVDDTH